MRQRDFHFQRMESYLRRHIAEEEFSADIPFRPSLTISRQCGSRLDMIRRSLVEYLDTIDESAVHGWALFDQSIIGKIVEDRLLPESALSIEASSSKFPIAEALVESLKLPTEKWSLFNHTAFTIRKLCEFGNAIVLGRAANFLASDLDNTFHVRLIGSPYSRTIYTRNRYHLSDEEAKEMVRKVDRSRAEYVKKYAHSDIEDHRAYHLIINTDHLSDEVIVRIIADSVIEWASAKAAEIAGGAEPLKTVPVSLPD